MKRIELPIEEIEKMFFIDKKTLNEIAEKYFVSSKTIRNRLREIGYSEKFQKGKGPKPILDSIDKDYIEKLLNDKNLTLKQVHLILNVSTFTLRKYMIKNNLKKVKRCKNAKRR